MVRTPVHFNLPHLVTRKLSRHSGGKHTCPLCFPSFSDKKASSPNLPAGGNWKAHLPNVFLPQNIFVIITPFITLRLVRGFLSNSETFFSKHYGITVIHRKRSFKKTFFKATGTSTGYSFSKMAADKKRG